MALDDIDRDMVRAVIAGEDSKYCSHDGFDRQAIEEAMRRNARGGSVIRGGSTISQQTAKNAFLWQGGGYVRKGLEAWFTLLIETFWGKRRIMEVYLNVAEMGPGIYGAQAAAKTYFKTDASKLTPAQSARLVAILPSPNKYKAVGSGRYVQRRSRKIGGAAGTIRREGLAGCVLN
jgi:monofunctional biosynthetic peptidoglycan transglycosylase